MTNLPTDSSSDLSPNPDPDPSSELSIANAPSVYQNIPPYQHPKIPATATIWRASSLGGCPLALSASYNNLLSLPHPSPVKAAFKLGHEAEPILSKYLFDKFKIRVLSRQHEIKIKINPLNYIVGHIDGQAHNSTLIEFKNLNSTGYNAMVKNQLANLDTTKASHSPYNIDLSSHPQYITQVQAYCYALKYKKIIFVIRNRDTDEITTFLSSPFTLDPLLAPLTFPAIRAKLASLISSALTENPPCTGSPYFCQYNYLHESPSKPLKSQSKSKSPTPAPAPSQSPAQSPSPLLTPLITQYKSLSSQRKTIDSELTDLKSLIISFLTPDTRYIINNSIVHHETRTVETLDTKKVRAYLQANNIPDMTKTTNTTYLLLKDIPPSDQLPLA